MCSRSVMLLQLLVVFVSFAPILATDRTALEPCFAEKAAALHVSPSTLRTFIDGLNGDVLFGCGASNSARNQEMKRAIKPEYFLPQWLAYTPTIVVYPRSSYDVSATVQLARMSNYTKLTPVGGRHGSQGYCFSGHIALDMSRMNDVVISKSNSEAAFEVGAGANLSVVKAALWEHGLVTGAGEFPGVGFAGWTLGGGYNPIHKLIGMGVDNVIRFQLVLADGSIVFADDKVNTDLFWALRGAGHSSFGVVTRLWVRAAYPITSLPYHRLTINLATNLEAAAATLSTWAQLKNGKWATEKVTSPEQYIGKLEPYGPMVLQMNFIAPLDTMENLTRAVQPLLDVSSGARMNHTTGWCTVDQVGDFFNNVDGGLRVRNAVRGKPDELVEAKLSMFIKKAGFEVYENALDFLRVISGTYPPAEGANGWIGPVFYLEPYEGRVVASEPHESAFFHRNVEANWVMDIYVNRTLRVDERKRQYDMALGYMASLTNPASLYNINHLLAKHDGVYQSYQNYRFKGFGEGHHRLKALQHYYGGNLPRLASIKRKVDPTMLFDFPQGIPLHVPLPI